LFEIIQALHGLFGLKLSSEPMAVFRVEKTKDFTVMSNFHTSTAQSLLSNKTCRKHKVSYNATKAAEEKPQIDLSSMKFGVSVIHKAFGEGIVTKIGENRIHISFGKAEKMFQYPSSFENGFLQLKSEQ
jgi:hypothetical protein